MVQILKLSGIYPIAIQKNYIVRFNSQHKHLKSSILINAPKFISSYNLWRKKRKSNSS